MPDIMTITDAAAHQVKKLLDARETPAFGVRIGVEKGGCSGLTYKLEYADEKQSFDEVIEYTFTDSEGNNGQDVSVRVLIDPKAIMYLLGSEMDYVEEQMKSGFVFKNPNESGRCGCGESFSV